MKKNRTNILIAILIISQVILISKTNNLQGQTENINTKMNNLSNHIRSDMSTVRSDIDEMLRQKASLIESAATEIGTVDADELTAPIIFTLTPKEISEHTAVSLDFDGESFPMERDGITFAATVPRDIFGDALPKIVIDENGVKKITQDDQINIWNIKDRIFPTMIPRFAGGTRSDNKAYKKKGNLNIDIKKVPSVIEFKEIRIVTKIDDKVISDEIIPNEMFSNGSYSQEIDKKVSLNNGQIYTMMAIAIDSLGLEHHYTMDHWVSGADHQREPWFDDE